MKQLTSNQIRRAKEPNQLGKPKITSSENYQNIYHRTRDSFAIIKQVSEILSDLEIHSGRYTYAREIADLFNLKSFDPILKGIFPIKNEEGAAFDDTIFFDLGQIHGERLALAVHLLKFSTDYLLQAFPKGQWDYLHGRIEAITKEIEELVTTFNNTKLLHRELENFKEFTENYEPYTLKGSDNEIVVSCDFCKISGHGNTLKEAITAVVHKPKCLYLEDNSHLSSEKIAKWFKVMFPGDFQRYNI